MQTVLAVVGTRPEGIKMAPVVQELRRRPDAFRCILCSTGQHREMLQQVLDLFGLTADIDLALMQPGQTLAALTARLFAALDDAVESSRPDWILAQGDTTTVMVAALLAYYRRIRFGHVEAGLRTGNRWHPFPEEMNRRIADLLADLYFAPTAHSRQTLLDERVDAGRIVQTGNTVIDALREVVALPYDWDGGPLRDLPRDRRLVLVTAHRRESFGETFRGICLALRDLAERFAPEGVSFVYPVHLNPNVRRPVEEILRGVDGIHLIEPIDYQSLLQLIRASHLVLTDSGGIQEEAPGLNVPVLVMRETTERPEGIDAGVVRLVGTTRERITSEATRLLTDADAHRAMAQGANPYGDGQASARIADALAAHAGEG